LHATTAKILSENICHTKEMPYVKENSGVRLVTVDFHNITNLELQLCTRYLAGNI
jgi:hypothetical protein